MKYLTIIRHAKSGWKIPTQSDFERSLNSGGKKEAPIMGRLLAQKPGKPDLFLSSPAIRAMETATAIASEMKINENEIQCEKDFYLANPFQIIDYLKTTDNAIEKVFYVGHNPGVTELVNYLSRDHIDDMPTCSFAHLRLEIEDWEETKKGCGRILIYDYPGNHV